MLNILEGTAKGRGVKWTELVKKLGDQSSIKVDLVDFAEVIKGLENEGVVKVVLVEAPSVEAVQAGAGNFVLLRA